MNIRSNVRRRRRKRIEQLLSTLPAGGEPARSGGWHGEHEEMTGASWNGAPMGGPQTSGEPINGVQINDAHRIGSQAPISGRERPNSSGSQPVSAVPASTGMQWGWPDGPKEQDPEKWWKEQQKISRRLGVSGGGSANRLLQDTHSPYRDSGGSSWSRFLSGFAIRLVLAAAVFSAMWIWLSSDLPGSSQARAWTVDAVTQDMDFQAVEAWYEHTFGGSPSFLPMFRSEAQAREVFGGWKRSDAVLPVQGRVVQSYEQDGSGVRIAAPGDSRVKAVYAGRVLQVETEADGKATVLIQHAGKIVTIYGNLQYPEVRAGDWVEAGDVLGSVPPPQDARGESLLYFAVRHNGQTVDPAEVVPFD